jgi:NTP pyrophosphatase (non-canonical NTP hydrolase)
MNLKEFQEVVKREKRRLKWDQFHQPKELLLAMVEEIGEFRNFIKWEQNPDKIKKIVLGIAEEKDETVANSPMTENQLRTLYYLASMNGKVNTHKDQRATEWLKQIANVKDLNNLTRGEAEKLINLLIRRGVQGFFSDILWLLGSLADYCEVDLEKALENAIETIKLRFLPGEAARILAGEYDGKYV